MCQIQLIMLTLSMRYGSYIYLIRRVDCAYVCGICVGRRSLINTCTHLMLRCQTDTVFFGMKKKTNPKNVCSLNHSPNLNCSPNVQTNETLNKAPLMTKAGPVRSVAGFEGRTCSPLVSVCWTRESTAAANESRN